MNFLNRILSITFLVLGFVFIYLGIDVNIKHKVIKKQIIELQGISDGLDNYSKQLDIYQDRAIEAKKYYDNECKHLKKKEI